MKLSPKKQVETILRAVAECYGVTLVDLRSRKRTKAVAFARQVAMYLARELVRGEFDRPLSYPDLAPLFGRGEHMTILHGCRVVAEAVKDPKILDRITLLQIACRADLNKGTT